MTDRNTTIDRYVGRQEIVLFNPLPKTLAHYAREMRQTLDRLNIENRTLSPRAPIDSDRLPLLTRGVGYLRDVRAVRRTGAAAVVLWPAFGWLEPVLWARRGDATFLIVHDPVPLRRQYGAGRIARRVSRVSIKASHVRLVCHTLEAADTTAQQLRIDPPSVGLHPILTAPSSLEQPPRSGHADPLVLIIGQHKPARDMSLVASLGPLLRSAGLRTRIAGTGWPAIEGWDTRPVFLTESEFDAELREASAIILPYHRYWQSGVAVRALECGVPAVGVDTHFLRTLFGPRYPGLVPPTADARGWRRAVLAILRDSTDIWLKRLSYQARVDRSWSILLSNTQTGSARAT